MARELQSGSRRWEALGALAVLLLAGCQPPPPAPDPVPAASLPGLDLRPQDAIVALAAAGDDSGDDSGTLHAVWRERIATEGGDGRSRVRYARAGNAGVDGGGRWSAPEEIVDVSGEPLRLVSAAGDLHLLAGARLDRWARGGPDGEWRRLPSLLERRAITFDAATSSGRLAVAFFERRAGGEIALSLVSVPLSEPRTEDSAPGQAAAPRVLATFPPSPFDPPAPRLIETGGRLLLLAAYNGESRRMVVEDGISSERITSSARLVVLESPDGGATWNAPEEIPDRDPPPAFISSVAVVALAVKSGADRPVGLFTAHGVYASDRGTDGWSPPRAIAELAPGALGGGTGAHSATAAASAVAWIDERHRKSDRSWWNPLGGAPWSDAPDQRNNDLFLLPGRQLELALTGVEVPPRRLTAEGSFSRTASLVEVGGRLHLLWAGRRQVGKELTSFDSAPELFHLFLPSPGPAVD